MRAIASRKRGCCAMPGKRRHRGYFIFSGKCHTSHHMRLLKRGQVGHWSDPDLKAQAVGSLGDTSGASAVLELMQEARSRWTLTGLLSAWGADPVTIREAFPATGTESTRDRIDCSWRQDCSHFFSNGRSSASGESR